MRTLTLTLLSFLFIAFSSPMRFEKISKESIRSQGKERTFYLFVPGEISGKTPSPLIVLLHGTGRNGLSVVDKWADLAKKENVIIVGPDASSSRGWKIPEDGPDFIYELVEALKLKYPIDARRVYLFGHSAGGGQALYLSLLESRYFAATAVHAGALNADDGPYIQRAKRKIPIAIFVGTNDQVVPLPLVRATRDALNGAGFEVALTEIKGHTHSYYDRAAEINSDAWEFLKTRQLDQDPQYQRHQFTQ